MASERAEKWLELYMQTGDAQDAVRQVYNCSEKSIPSRASHLKARYAFEIDQQLRKNMISDSVKAYRIIKDLANCSSSETVKLAAARDLMDRGGFKPDSVIRLEEKPMTRAELVAKVEESRLAVIQSMSAEEIAQALKSIPGESKRLEEAS
jgi:rhamnose utilization protein RhaD (predicted bifunctional aldolase and dehydrogenase)